MDLWSAEALDRRAVGHLQQLCVKVREVIAAQDQPLTAEVQPTRQPYPRLYVADGRRSLGVVVAVGSFYTERESDMLGPVYRCGLVAVEIVNDFPRLAREEAHV